MLILTAMDASLWRRDERATVLTQTANNIPDMRHQQNMSRSAVKDDHGSLLPSVDEEKRNTVITCLNLVSHWFPLDGFVGLCLFDISP